MGKKRGSSRRAPSHGRYVRRSQRQRRRRYLIVCGGAVTEQQYFECLGKHVNVAFTFLNKNRSPQQLASWAADLKKKDIKDAREEGSDPYTDVWVVVDVDDFHDHHAAQQICDSNDIELVVSNPCFEVWLVDHVKPCPDSCTLTSVVEQQAAELGMTCGNRNKYIDTVKLDKHINDAVIHAQRHNTDERRRLRRSLIPHREKEYAPWTDMVLIKDLPSNCG